MGSRAIIDVASRPSEVEERASGPDGRDGSATRPPTNSAYSDPNGRRTYPNLGAVWGTNAEAEARVAARMATFMMTGVKGIEICGGVTILTLVGKWEGRWKKIWVW